MRPQPTAWCAVYARRIDRTASVRPSQGGCSNVRCRCGTFGEWDDLRPGFFEADLVAHCGGYTDGAFLYTLCLTDVATGWTECLPLLHRIPSEVVQAVRQVRRLLPFPLLGFDSDNGHEFINFELVAYCEQERITFTRGRVANKNDQCFIEQKNGSIVRQLVGYDRFEGQPAYRQLAELYRAVRLYVNFFQPSLKLRTKRRTGAHVSRTYHPAQTPYQRLVASGVLDPTARQRLERIYRALDPVRLLRQLETLQDALWRHAVYRTHGTPVGYAHPRSELIDVTFKASTCGLDGDVSVVAEDASPADRRGAAPPTAHRKYRRTQKSRGPRTYRTGRTRSSQSGTKFAAGSRQNRNGRSSRCSYNCRTSIPGNTPIANCAPCIGTLRSGEPA